MPTLVLVSSTRPTQVEHARVEGETQAEHAVRAGAETERSQNGGLKNVAVCPRTLSLFLAAADYVHKFLTVYKNNRNNNDSDNDNDYNISTIIILMHYFLLTVPTHDIIRTTALVVKVVQCRAPKCWRCLY